MSLAAGQPATDSGADPDYLRLLLDTGRVAVADDGERAVGWGGTKETAAGSLLTDLFVDPDHHGRGIGRALLDMLWPDRTDVSPRFTFSSQHALALPLYLRAGLTPFWPLLYLTGEPARLDAVDARATIVAGEAAADAERQHTGVDRHADYAYWTRDDQAAAVMIHEGQRLIAVGAASPGGVSHLCVLEDAAANVAVTAALHALEATTATLCLPGPHPALVGLLERGFRIEDYDIYMSTHRTAAPVTWSYSPGLG